MPIFLFLNSRFYLFGQTKVLMKLSNFVETPGCKSKLAIH